MSKEDLENELYSLISHAERDFVQYDHEDEEYGIDNSYHDANNAYNEGLVYAYKQVLKLINE